MRKRTKALSIAPETRQAVWLRDKGRCVLCGSRNAAPNAHFIARSHSGLGIPENVVTLCFDCHRRYDQTAERPMIRERLREYLSTKYPNWDESRLIYKKNL